MLPDIFTAFSCCAASSVSHLNVFCISAGQEKNDESQSLAADFSAVRQMMADAGIEDLFPCKISFASCVPSFRSAREISGTADDSLLISALRGKGLPLSLQTDRETVEWCFADLMNQPDDSSSISPFLSWLDNINAYADNSDPVQLVCLADMADPFSAGITLMLLHDFKKRFKNRPVSVFLLALAETSSPVPESFFPALRSSLQAMNERRLLHQSEEDTSFGAEAAWILSLPSSMADSAESFRFIAFQAARILGVIYTKKNAPAYGIHKVETEGTLSLSMLRDQAPSFVASMNLYIWLLADVLPSLRNYLSHSSRFRVFSMNPRTSQFRHLLPSDSSGGNSVAELDILEKSIRKILMNVLRFMRSVPSSLRILPENTASWQQAVNACGRYITVAAEYDISSTEAHESGLDAVRPVHRVSMADTEEEKLVRRLQDIKMQLDSEQKSLEDILEQIGGYRSVQVRMDCLKKCRAALKDAETKAAVPNENAEHLAVLQLERRIRLLKAAVSRCETELSPQAVHDTVSSLPKHAVNSADPYAGTVFIAETCHILEKMCSEEHTEPLSRSLPLFPDIPIPDHKLRWKALQAICRDSSSPEHPIAFLVAKALELCRNEISSVRYFSRGDMPDLPLLPDLVPDKPLQRIRDVLSLLPDTANTENDTAELRGLLAMLILRQYRRRTSEESALKCVSLTSGDAPVLRYWLAANSAEEVSIVSLEKDDQDCPFLLILPGQRIIPAKRIAEHDGLVPSFATWFDRERRSFSDPCGNLGEGDKKLLIHCLNTYSASLAGGASSSLSGFLRAFADKLSNMNAASADIKSLKTRIRAVCGLRFLPVYSADISVTTCFYEHFLAEDNIGSALSGTKGCPAYVCSDIPEECLYRYRGIPFARADSSALLVSSCAAGEDLILKRIDTECAILSEYSDDYRDALFRNVRELLDRYPDVLSEFREAAESIIAEAADPVGSREPVFEWPWDMKSPSMLTVLRECLGDNLPESALHPFSDCLAVFPARGMDVIGDSLLSAMCMLAPNEKYTASADSPEIVPDAVIPPLSPEFGDLLSRLPEGRTLLHPGLLSFERNMNDTVRVTLTLDGTFPIHLVRVYKPEEILNLYSHDIPTVAIWPSVPFPTEEWKAYYIFAHMSDPYTASALSESGSAAELLQTSQDRYVAVLESFPVCISLYREGKTVGILPNVLPRPIRETCSPVEICVDFGSSGTSVVFSSERRCRPMQGPVMVRTLLNNPVSSRNLLRREFLPALPVSALFPTVSRLFRNVPGENPVPFADGIVLMSSNLEDLLSTPSEAIYASLRWEEEKGRSGYLCLHQILLMAALQARCSGSPAVSWRFSLPDGMAKEGRESLMNMYLSIIQTVMQESGYPVPPEGLPVAFASDSSALGAYFRYCASDDTRGGFMVLDLGACTADISLFLRGREQAVRTCQIPLGIHYMMLPALLRDPDLFSREFSFCADTGFQKDLSLFSKALHSARTDPAALRRARISLDYLIADRLPLMLSCMLQLYSGGMPSEAGSLLLFYFAYLMMLSGLVLLQIAADPNRNDFLPEQMALCLAGRGSALIESLPSPLKASLWRFLSMFRNKRIASLSLLFSAEKKMEIPVGLSMLQDVYHMLPPASVIPASISVRPEELLPEFLLRFRKEFPASAGLLFPGFFSNDYYHPFTERGESLITASIDQSFPPAGTVRPYDSLAAWPGNLLELMS